MRQCHLCVTTQELFHVHKFSDTDLEWVKTMVDEALPTTLHDWAFLPALKVPWPPMTLQWRFEYVHVAGAS